MQQESYLFRHKAYNSFKTFILMAGTFILLSGIGYLLAKQYGNINFIYVALGLGIGLNFFSYWFSAPLALRFSGAKPIDLSVADDRKLCNIVQRLAQHAQLPTPTVHIIEDSNPNAFATGRNASHAAVAVTTGLLQILNEEELSGVIAHELAHIGNKDILISSIVAVMAGVITHLLHLSTLHRGDGEQRGSSIFTLITLIAAPIFASILQMAVSRSREFQADATGALITGHPEGLAQALLKIHAHNTTPMIHASEATAHMYISNPFGNDQEEKKVGMISRLFMSHPPVEERVAKLRGI